MADLSDPTFWIPTIISLGILALAYYDLRRRQTQDRASLQAGLRLLTTQREKAYVYLHGILQRLGVDASTVQKTLLTIDYEKLEKAVEENYQFLFDATKEAWRNKKVTSGGAQQTQLEAGQFFGEVRIHFERLDKRNPAHALDEQ